MDYSELRQEKIKILNRLIRESTITLEEILMLLQEQEQPAPVSTPSYLPGTTAPWSRTIPLTGTITVSNGTGISFSNTTTYANPNTPQTQTADLNT